MKIHTFTQDNKITLKSYHSVFIFPGDISSFILTEGNISLFCLPVTRLCILVHVKYNEILKFCILLTLNEILSQKFVSTLKMSNTFKHLN